MYERLKGLYPKTSEQYILEALKHIENSEVLTGNPEKLEAITDAELKMYYEQIIYDLGGKTYEQKRNNGKNRDIRGKKM